MRLAGDDPTVDPVVDFAMLDDERDWPPHVGRDRRRRAGARPSGDAGASATWLPYDRSLDGVRAALGDYVHAAGTCAMGTVVDPSCRLVGYEGVVVCDASVMPEAPRANTHLPTVMIAERIAAAIAASLPAD